MKLIFCLTWVQVLLACAVAGYPLGGYRTREFATSDLTRELANGLVARDASAENFSRRALLDLLKGNKGALTDDQIRAKKLKEERKAYIEIGKHHEKIAKLEMGPGKHKVDVKYFGGGYAEHHKLAEEKTQKEWKTNKNLQQFRHADVSVTSEPGKEHITAKYHNGPGSAGGSTLHFFVHHK